MRISGIKGEPGYGKMLEFLHAKKTVKFFLDGVEISPVVSADEEWGEIVIIKRNYGRIVFRDDGKPAYETLKGDVKIEFADDANIKPKTIKKDDSLCEHHIMMDCPILKNKRAARFMQTEFGISTANHEHFPKDTCHCDTKKEIDTTKAIDDIMPFKATVSETEKAMKILSLATHDASESMRILCDAMRGVELIASNFVSGKTEDVDMGPAEWDAVSMTYRKYQCKDK